MSQTVISISNPLARPEDNPSPRTRNGYPHNSVNTVALNWELKCDHIPSRVPGLPHTSRSDLASLRILILATSTPEYGESSTTRVTTTIPTRPSREANANAWVQPRRFRAM